MTPDFPQKEKYESRGKTKLKESKRLQDAFLAQYNSV